uniref:Xylosyltransferase 1 n=1 Tax=Anthurium amnicola TaxID=1678845 RepID=A0A1D1Y6F1_9ARAE
MQGAAAAPPPLLSSLPSKETRSLYCLLATSLVSVLFVLSFSSFPSYSSLSPPPIDPSPSPSTASAAAAADTLSSSLPSLAYFISGSDGDGDRLLRLLSAAYHPRNLYLLHLDRTAPQEQRRRLALAVRSVPVFRSAGNVHVVGRADYANPRGSSALAAVLHGAAMLLRLGSDWGWFVNLDASDYPLVTQDDLLHLLSFLPNDTNFVQHTSHIGWRVTRRVKPIIVDPGLYLSSKSDIFYATQKRDLPNAYRLFSGSPSVVISREFVDFCILGVDNLPRTLLMYYANTPSSHTNYFHTVLCNSIQFNGSIINHNLHYVSLDVHQKRDPRLLGLTDFDNITRIGAAFATRFVGNSPILDKIDQELLNRQPGKIVPGGWCLGEGSDPCSIWGDGEILLPGPGAKRLENALVQLLANDTFRSHQCTWE